MNGHEHDSTFHVNLRGMQRPADSHFMGAARSGQLLCQRPHCTTFGPHLHQPCLQIVAQASGPKQLMLFITRLTWHARMVIKVVLK